MGPSVVSKPFISVFGRLKNLYRRVDNAAEFFRGRLKSHDAQIAELREAVAALMQSALGQDRAAASGQPTKNIERMLLHAEKVSTDLDRLADLYESTTGRVAAAEQAIQGLAERMTATQTPRQASTEPAHAAAVPSSNASTSAGTMGDTDSISKSLKARFAALVLVRLGRIAFARANSLRNLAKEYEKAVLERDSLRNVAEEYKKVVLERDSLRNLRDELVRLRQDAARPGGIAKSAKQVYASDRPPFPKAVLDTADPLCVSVVDIGAQNLASEDHIYAPLQQTGSAKIIGFEPLTKEAEARRSAEPNILLLDHFVGRGGLATFHVARFNPTSSLLEPDIAFLSKFVALPQMCETVATQTVRTTPLDDVGEITDCDFLKMDVQGGELDVLKGAVRILHGAAVVHCEVEFAPLYKAQPLFADVDSALRAAGFELIDLMNAGYSGYIDLPRPLAQSRLLWAEAVYFKSPERLAALGATKLLRAAFIAHVNYGMYDLAAHYLAHYDKLTGRSTREAYAHALEDVQRQPDTQSVSTAGISSGDHDHEDSR